MSADVIGVIEAAYSAERDDLEWLRTVAEKASPGLDQRMGVAAGRYSFDAEGCLRIEAQALVNLDPAILAAGTKARRTNRDVLMAAYSRGPHCSALSTWASPGDPSLRSVAPLGVRDSVGVFTGDPSLRGYVLMAPTRDRAHVPRAMALVWSRVAAHLAAAFRLRHRDAAIDAADAVLSPSGRVEHAQSAAKEPGARVALTEGAHRIDRARGSLRRRDPHEAVDLWRALVDGRWSLVDHFDHDGKRFLVARRNESFRASAAQLSVREREVLALAALGHTNKFVGYQLGLSESAVATHLSRAARKLGARSRVALIAAYRSAQGVTK